MSMIMLAFRLRDLGDEEEPGLTRVGEFIEIHIPVVGDHENWEPKFGEVIPRELVIDPQGDDAYYYAGTPRDGAEDSIALCKYVDNLSDEGALESRLADFCIQLIDSALGPPKAAKRTKK